MTDIIFPHKIPLYEQVVELIEAKIANGELKLGDKLPTEYKLAADYKVSRTVIREAMKTLKEKGLVETQVAKGTFVVNNIGKSVQSTFMMAVQETPENAIFHLIEMRYILEPEIAALAAIRATDEEIAGMESAVEKMEQAVTDQEHMDDFLAGDYDFHMRMARASANPFLQIIISPVVNMMRETQKYHLYHVKGGNLRSQKNHKLILEAIKNRDPENARKRMRVHIEQVRTDVEETEGKGK